jgi:cell division protein FtsQ
VSGLVRAESLFRARRRAERRKTARPLLALAIVTTVVGAALWAGFSSPFLRLDTVTVKGTSRLSVAQVLAAASVRTGTSLLQVPVDDVRRRIERLAPVARVRVERSWPHGLVIDVVERTPAAAVATGGGTDAAVVLVDAGGTAFATAASAPAGVLDLRMPAPAPGSTSATAAAALSVWAALPAAVRREVQWLGATSPDAVTFRLTRGATVVWGSPDDSPTKLAVLATLMHHRASTYDVSTPTVAVTR